MHQLLALQIKKHLSSDKGLTPELQGLLAEVDRHYQETEQVRRKPGPCPAAWGDGHHPRCAVFQVSRWLLSGVQ